MSMTFNATDRARRQSPYRNTNLLAADQQVKAGATDVEYLNVYNPDTALAYLQLYDALAADVTVGTTVPTHSIPIPAGAIYDVQLVQAMQFDVGLTIAMTTTPGGAVAPGTGAVVNARYV